MSNRVWRVKLLRAFKKDEGMLSGSAAPFSLQLEDGSLEFLYGKFWWILVDLCYL